MLHPMWLGEITIRHRQRFMTKRIVSECAVTREQSLRSVVQQHQTVIAVYATGSTLTFYAVYADSLLV
jgi:hypothetical protein